MRFTLAISRGRTPLAKNVWLMASIVVFLAVWTNSLLGTTDINNWLLENTLTFLFLFFLIFTYRKHQLSDLSYLLICVFLCLHVYGSKYTYAENPFGYWLKDVFHMARNQYDRIVHFSFGFLLAYPAREILERLQLARGIASRYFAVEFIIAAGALYELGEWLVAMTFAPDWADRYLGQQGDIWDAQKDMALETAGDA